VFIAWSIAADWGFWAIAVLVTLNSIFGAIFMPAINALVSDIVPKAKRLDGYAVTRSAGNLGWAAGPAIGGFFAHSSYASLFLVSGVLTMASALVFFFFFKPPVRETAPEAFRFSDLIALKKDTNLAVHCSLVFLLYLVVAQLIAPFSVYSVEMVGISESSLGLLFAINGIMVSLLQIPITQLLGNFRFTTQLASGALLYFVGYGVMGLFSHFSAFVFLMILITTGEMFMSPPAITLTSRLAPEGRMGRYMGVFGFFTTAGWSLGPLYGGYFLDVFADNLPLAWLLISSTAALSAIGFALFGRRLEVEFNRKDRTD
jgi:MFS family permease